MDNRIISDRRCEYCENLMLIQEVRQCSRCTQVDQGTERPYYCISRCFIDDCRTAYCQKEGHETCFQKHGGGRNHKLADRHKPLDPLPSLCVAAVTSGETDMQSQRELHRQDQIAQWFVVRQDPTHGHLPVLSRTNRFQELCNPGIVDNGWSSEVFPSFVSFIGDTAVGKSTLLRAMILMGLMRHDEETSTPSDGTPQAQSSDEDRVSRGILRFKGALEKKAAFPVTRIKNIDYMQDPTTHGVHLYKDQAGVLSRHWDLRDNMRLRQTPILFADCEGFRAGSQTTNSERSSQPDASAPGLSVRRSSLESRESTRSEASDQPHLAYGHRSSNRREIAAEEHFRSERHYISEQLITATSVTQHGKDGLDIFYARLLYAISDVIVFVQKTDNLSEDLQRLMEWALKAVNRAVNQLPFKTLIIVRNAASLHKEELYDPENLRRGMFERLDPLWKGSKELRQYRDDYHRDHPVLAKEIRRNEDLFNHFFQDVKVCYVPDSIRCLSNPNELFQQYQRLRDQIIQASKESQLQRSRVWMQYNVPTMSQVLRSAFEHFRVSEERFDFYLAARNDNPNPTSVAGHIANFLRHLHQLKEPIEEMFCEVVSVNLIAYAIRHFSNVVDPDETFESTLKEWCINGLTEFLHKDQGCARVLFRTSRPCVLKYARHAGEHLDRHGFSEEGHFESTQRVGEEPLRRIQGNFIRHFTLLCQEGQQLPSSQEAYTYRRQILKRFSKQWAQFQSNKTCLACLQAYPDHMLPCKHTFCDKCVKDFGSPGEDYESSWTWDTCVLCQQNYNARRPLYHLHPRCAGVRILTLDGGGVRGIVELALLERLNTCLGLATHLRDFFDIIVGTSTGGIITLGLAATNLTISDLKAKFLDLATATFKKTHGDHATLGLLDFGNYLSLAMMLLRLHGSLYRSSPLREALLNVFPEDRNLFSDSYRPVKAAVTTIKDNGVFCFMSNYNRPDKTGSPDFEREDDNTNEIKIWEAGLATSAAPVYFKPFTKQITGKSYVDGALVANLPIAFALDEMGRLFSREPRLDILLSIGAGMQDKQAHIHPLFKVGGLEKLWVSFRNGLDTEKSWKDLIEDNTIYPEHVKERIKRLNCWIDEPYVDINDHRRMKDLAKSTLERSEQAEFSAYIDSLALSLLAKLFYFEPDPPPRGVTWAESSSIKGTIRCRLGKSSEPMRQLMARVDSFWHKEVIDLKWQPGSTINWSRTAISEADVLRVTRDRDWLRIPCRLYRTTRESCYVAIAVSFKGRQTLPELFPISGFPNDFKELAKRSS